jgi:hypothetical protein
MEAAADTFSSPSTLPSTRQLSGVLFRISQHAETKALHPTTRRILMGRLRVAAQLLVNAALCDQIGHKDESAAQRRLILGILADARSTFQQHA